MGESPTTKIFTKKEKELETLIQTIRIYDQDIGIEFGIEKCALLIMKMSKRETTEGIELSKQKSIRILGEKRKLQVHRNIRSRHHQTNKNERKNTKNLIMGINT